MGNNLQTGCKELENKVPIPYFILQLILSIIITFINNVFDDYMYVWYILAGFSSFKS